MFRTLRLAYLLANRVTPSTRPRIPAKSARATNLVPVERMPLVPLVRLTKHLLTFVVLFFHQIWTNSRCLGLCVLRTFLPTGLRLRHDPEFLPKVHGQQI